MKKLLLETVIEEAKTSDLKGIYSIYRQYFHNKKQYHNSLFRRIHSDDQIFLVGRDPNGEIISFIDSTIELDSDMISINYFAIDNQKRNRGIGTKTIVSLASEAKKYNIENIVTIPMKKTSSQEFYKKIGFRQDGIIQYIAKTDYILHSFKE